jgi:hypothetical protein
MPKRNGIEEAMKDETIGKQTVQTTKGGASLDGRPILHANNNQPWRALKRGFTLLITNTRPLRRTMRQLRSRSFRLFSELATFMIVSRPAGLA